MISIAIIIMCAALLLALLAGIIGEDAVGCCFLLLMAFILLLLGSELYRSEHFKRDMVKMKFAEYYLNKDDEKTWRMLPKYQENYNNIKPEKGE